MDGLRELFSVVRNDLTGFNSNIWLRSLERPCISQQLQPEGLQFAIIVFFLGVISFHFAGIDPEESLKLPGRESLDRGNIFLNRKFYIMWSPMTASVIPLSLV